MTSTSRSDTDVHVSIIDVDVSITDVHVSIIDVDVSILDSYDSISSIDVDVGSCDIRLLSLSLVSGSNFVGGAGATNRVPRMHEQGIGGCGARD